MPETPSEGQSGASSSGTVWMIQVVSHPASSFTGRGEAKVLEAMHRVYIQKPFFNFG
jgi:hypothetical protein